MTESATHRPLDSGAAGAERVAVDRRDGRAEITITDDGVGGAVEGGGTGLRGLADRLDALGGRLSVESNPGAGTTVRADVPVTES